MPRRSDICPCKYSIPSHPSFEHERKSVLFGCSSFWNSSEVYGDGFDALLRNLIPGTGMQACIDANHAIARVLFLGKDYDYLSQLFGFQLNSFAPCAMYFCPVIIELGQTRNLRFSYNDSYPDKVFPADEVSQFLNDPDPTAQRLVESVRDPNKISQIKLTLESRDLLLNPREFAKDISESVLVDQSFITDITPNNTLALHQLAIEAIRRLEGNLGDEQHHPLIHHDFIVLASEDDWLHLVMLELIKEETNYLQDFGMDHALIKWVIRSKFLELGETGLKDSPHFTNEKAYSEIESVCSTLRQVDMDTPLLSAAMVAIRFNALVSYLINHPGEDVKRSDELMQRAVSAINVILDGQLSTIGSF